MTFRRFTARRRSRIVTSLLCALLFSVSSATAQSDLSSEPFTVFVAREKAFARCGPADDYYRTDQLRHGQQLDVYLQTDDGWLGVRPPESSFCWVPASAVEVAKNGETATVIEDKTVSWIGTHLGRARQYRWQVQMAEGERVTVLGRSERDGPDGPQTWLRIVPPSGEFRWVHRDQIVESAEELVASLRNQPTSVEQPTLLTEELPRDQPSQHREGGLRSTIVQTANSIQQNLIKNPSATSTRRNPEGTPAPKPALAVASEYPELQEAPRPHDTASATIGSGLRKDWNPNDYRESLSQPEPNVPVAQVSAPPQPAPEIADAGDVASTEFIGRPRITDIGANTSAPQNNIAAAESNWVSGLGRITANGTGQRAVQPATYLHATSPQAATRTVAAERIADVQHEVRDADADKLQLLLSRLMAGGASAAEVEPIVTRARNLSMTTLDQVAAGRARLLAERAEQYQGVARRRDGNTVIRENGIPVIPAGGALSPGQDGGALSPGQDSGGATMPAERASQASGFLVQVYSARANSPPFALTDHAGNTIAYVTPSPGINLRGHLNSHIKVIGHRGYLQGLNMPHILASQAARTPE